MSEKMKDLKDFNPRALIDKYSINKKSTDSGYSSFWMGDTLDSYSSIFDDEDIKPKVDLIALSSYRRAISNFVNIRQSFLVVDVRTSLSMYIHQIHLL